MTKKKNAVIDRVKEQAERGQLADDITISYRLHGGVSGEQLDERVLVTAGGDALVDVRDELHNEKEGHVRGTIDREEVLELSRLVSRNASRLIPASKARFLPDSLIGTVTLGVGDDTETYYFDADAEACEHRGHPIPEEVLAIRDRFKRIERTCLDKATGRGEADDA